MESRYRDVRALPLIYGTVVSSLIAIVLAGVVGILAAAFLSDFAPPAIARPLSFTIELPSLPSPASSTASGASSFLRRLCECISDRSCSIYSDGRRFSLGRSTVFAV